MILSTINIRAATGPISAICLEANMPANKRHITNIIHNSLFCSFTSRFTFAEDSDTTTIEESTARFCSGKLRLQNGQVIEGASGEDGLEASLGEGAHEK